MTSYKQPVEHLFLLISLNVTLSDEALGGKG